MKRMVERDPDYQPKLIQKSFSRLRNVLKRVQSLLQNQKHHKMEIKKIENFNKFLSGQMTNSDLLNTKTQKIIEKATLPPWWWLFDLVSIFF